MFLKESLSQCFDKIAAANMPASSMPIIYHNSVTFDLDDISIVVADVGRSERNKLQVIVPKGGAGEFIIDELKERLHTQHIIFSSGIESSFREPHVRHVFVGNGLISGDGPVQRVSKQLVMLILVEMQHDRGIEYKTLLPLPEMVSIISVETMGTLSRSQLHKLEKELATH